MLAGLLLILSPFGVFAQKTANNVPSNGKIVSKELARPKLVVGIVVDQMRWDFLYRYYDRYTNNGFKRLVQQGFSCENTFLPYTPAITACGHACVYTGSVPALHGILGNNWYSRDLNRRVYCVEDTTVQTVGTDTKDGLMSPRNMLTNTIGDELRIATNFKSKVVGIALKDRGAILPAGHAANAAFWYDGERGAFITSTYYMNDLPAFAKEFNAQKWPEKYLSTPWSTLYPINTYTQSTADDVAWEGKFKGEKTSTFPHDLSKSTNMEDLCSTPFGNTYTLEFAKKALDFYQLGKGDVTDMLNVSLSSTDYVGHQFGPNSIETEDTYLRLDKDLGAFFDYLDAKVGKGNYTLFLTADHGVQNIAAFNKEHGIPAGVWNQSAFTKAINEAAKKEFGISDAILTIQNYQVYMNYKAIEQAGKKLEQVKAFIHPLMKQQVGIANVIDEERWGDAPLIEPIRSMALNGYNTQRSGDFMLFLQPGWSYGGATGANHGVWNPYDTHIPLVWMGWGIKQGGSTNRTTYMTDIASTVAALLHIQMPNGAVGHAIEEVKK
ncbi:alkaline phosphatase PafA [Chitinophaga skermanii]|nr:alkaline phosphatase PafA [Chitinophaga skermanii]